MACCEDGFWAWARWQQSTIPPPIPAWLVLTGGSINEVFDNIFLRNSGDRSCLNPEPVGVEQGREICWNRNAQTFPVRVGIDKVWIAAFRFGYSGVSRTQECRSDRLISNHSSPRWRLQPEHRGQFSWITMYRSCGPKGQELWRLPSVEVLQKCRPGSTQDM